MATPELTFESVARLYDPVSGDTFTATLAQLKEFFQTDNGLPRLTVQNADVPLSSVDYVNVTDLKYDVLAGRSYVFDFLLLVRTALATNAIGASVNFPAGSLFAAILRTNLSNTGGFITVITAPDGGSIPTQLPAADLDYYLTIQGTIIPATDGVLVCRARREIAGGAEALNVRRGSTGRLWELRLT